MWRMKLIDVHIASCHLTAFASCLPREELEEAGVEVAPYDDIVEAVGQFPSEGRKLMMDPSSVNFGLRTGELYVNQSFAMGH